MPGPAGRQQAGPGRAPPAPPVQPLAADAMGRRTSDEVAFLEQGMQEVQRTAQMVYMENMDLRARIELLKVLTTKLADISGLPEDVQSDVRTLLDGAVPPRDALEAPDSAEGEPSTARGFAADQQSFAACLHRLCKSMDRYAVAPKTPRQREGHVPEACSQARQDPECEQETECEQNEVLALTEYGESVWCRTKNVCRELFDGWM